MLNYLKNINDLNAFERMKKDAIALLKENGIDLDQKTLREQSYRNIIELYIKRGLDINELYKIVYESSMTPNPVHRQIDEDNLLRDI